MGKKVPQLKYFNNLRISYDIWNTDECKKSSGEAARVGERRRSTEETPVREGRSFSLMAESVGGVLTGPASVVAALK